MDPARATTELQQWQQAGAPSPAAWEGAREAAVLVPGLGLAQQLWHVGQADAACRQRLLEDACYRLDEPGVQTLLAAAQASAAGFSLWERALQQRLTGLGLLAATNGPAVDAPRR